MYHFKKFLESKLKEKLSDAYLFILWSVYKNLNNNNVKRRSDVIKNELANLNISEFDLNSAISEIKTIVSNEAAASSEINNVNNFKVRSIQIKNFRGFGSDSVNTDDKGVKIDFVGKSNKILNKTIIYAPNGGGKTSFCEAFEYKLTNDIKECHRRNEDLSTYVRHKGKRPEIVLEFTSTDCNYLSEEQRDFFSKCFIDKNRIQEFALFKSRDTNVSERDVIAVLIGLESFQNFIDSFVQSNSFDLSKLKSTERRNKYIELSNKSNGRLTLREAYQEKLSDVYSKIADDLKIDENQSYCLWAKINEIDRQIEEKDKLINSFYNDVILQDKTEFDSIILETSRCFDLYSKNKNKLLEHAAATNYKALFDATIALKHIHIEAKCPLCDTPFEKVVVNPFDKAQKELDKLESLAILQQNVNKYQKELEFICLPRIIKFYDDIKSNIMKINESGKIVEIDNFPFDLPAFIFQEKFFEKKLEVINVFINYCRDETDKFRVYFEILDRFKTVKIKQTQIIKEQKEEQERLREKRSNLKHLSESAKKLINDIEVINKELQSTSNGELERAVQLENKRNDFVDKVEISYKIFKNDLDNYKRDLEKNEISGIESDVLNYYKTLNQSDEEIEEIKSIKIVIPENNNQKYQIMTIRNNRKESAAVLLSEGHLRVLGLSVIFSVAKKYKIPFLIFDDVVNTIDAEHRSNLIELFYKDPYLKSIQLIITTHDRFFWEKFCNFYSQKINKKDRSYMSYILEYTNTGTICIQYDIGFCDKIEQALKNYDIRQALLYCRVYFETMVVRYCVENQKKIESSFNRRCLSKDNMLQPSLESIYKKVFEDFPEDQDLKFIKDHLTWSSLNQEHHAFDENSFNLVHSKTSAEISNIFQAIKNFEETITAKNKN